MSLQEKTSAERVHIGFFGLRNSGKSSLVNAVTGQNLSVVSSVKGTTTDPVRKAMELLPLGPVVILDTPGIDDEGKLGELRVQRTRQALAKTDVAVLVRDARTVLNEQEETLLSLFREKKIPYIIAANKSDLLETPPKNTADTLFVSAKTKEGVKELKEKIAAIGRNAENQKPLVADLVQRGDTVVLVVPIDESAPKGRLILPQQQTIRELLEAGVTVLVTRESELKSTLSALNAPPRLVITDSQVFGEVSTLLPPDVPLTSFSILFARYKGDLATLVQGAATLKKIKTGDKVLISEGCTHHRQCGDIGTVKLPRLIEKVTGQQPQFHFTSGTEFPERVEEYRLVIHCGGCMLNEREMKSRRGVAASHSVPMTNYGMALAAMNGILDRSLEPFGEF